MGTYRDFKRPFSPTPAAPSPRARRRPWPFASWRFLAKGDSSAVVFLIGFAPVALPVVKSMKVTGSGLEIEVKDLRNEIAAFGLQMERVERAEIAQERPNKVDTEVLKEPITLVFYTDAAEESSVEVITRLKTDGFVAKGISTDFSELGDERKTFGRKQAYVKYSPGFHAKAEDAKAILSSLGFGSIRVEEVNKFRSSDIRVGLF